MTKRFAPNAITRRRMLKSGIGFAAAALSRVVTRGSRGFAVSLVTPPAWLSKAYDLIRNIQHPRIRSYSVKIAPQGGDERARVQQSIDDISNRGGGRLLLAPGEWRINGPLLLKSYVELHLESDASVIFSSDREHYLPPVLTRWEGTDMYGYSPCIYVQNAHDVAITGDGTLAMALGGDIESWRFEQAEAQKELRSMGAHGVPLGERNFGKGKFLRPSFIQFIRCERVLIEGIRIGSIPFWGVHLLYSRHATVRGITAESNRVNNDGVDIDSSSFVLIEGCLFRTGDDCIAIKSGRDLDGRMVGIPSEKIVIRDCQMPRGSSAGIAIGSEMSGGIRDVYIFRCDMGRVETAVNIKSNLDRGGFVERVRVWNVTAKECARVVQITTSYHGYMGGNFPPRFEDIEIDDVRCDKAKEAIVIKGATLSPVKQVTLKNMRVISADKATLIKDAEKLLCEQVEISGRTLLGGCS